MRLPSSRRRIETSLDEIFERSSTARFQVIDQRANPEQQYAVTEARVLLAKALDRLAPIYKQVLHMFSYAGVAGQGSSTNLRCASGNGESPAASSPLQPNPKCAFDTCAAKETHYWQTLPGGSDRVTKRVVLL
jgi:hypothetical protein